MNYNLLFRWFVGLGIDDAVWVPTVLTKNRDRLLTTDMSRRVMAAILSYREVAPLLSDDHLSVDGALVKAWASMKSFQPKEKAISEGDDNPSNPPDTSVPTTSSSQSTAESEPMTRPTRRNRNAEVDFRGERRSNATHASTTDPDVRLFKKSARIGQAQPGGDGRTGHLNEDDEVIQHRSLLHNGHIPFSLGLDHKTGSFLDTSGLIIVDFRS